MQYNEITGIFYNDNLNFVLICIKRSALCFLVSATIKPFKLDMMFEALSDVGVQGITVTEVKGFCARRVTLNCTEVQSM